MSKRANVIVGQKFNYLTVVEDLGAIKNNRTHVRCLCDCDNEATFIFSDLKSGNTKSCGCLSRKLTGDRRRTHGFSQNNHYLYKTWLNMKSRCFNKNVPHYKNYGARGITVCKEWAESFEQFIEDMGDRPENASLDRIDNNKGYSKENCRWSTPKEQGRNTRRNQNITFEGRTMCLEDWASEIGIYPGALHKRLKKPNWSLARCLTQPSCRSDKNKTTNSLY